MYVLYRGCAEHQETGRLALLQADSTRNEPPWPPRAYSWYVVGILSAAYTVSFIDRQVLNLLVEPIRHDLQISDTQISLLQGFAFAIFYSLMGVPIARLADRGNRRNIIAAGIALWCLMTAACGLARNFLQLFLARIGVGVGEAALSPPAYSIIADYFPPERLAVATGVYALGIYAGAGIAMLVGGAVIELVSANEALVLPLFGALQPWQATFVVVGMPGLLVAGLMFTVREPARRDASSARAEGHVRISWRELWNFLKLRKAGLLTLTIGFCFIGIVIIGILAWTPTLFIRIHGWSAADIGLAYGLVLLLFGTSGSVLGGLWADSSFRRGRRDAHVRTAMFAGLLALPFAFFMPLVEDARLALGLLVPTTFLLSAPVGLSAAAIQLITPNRMRAQVTALYLLVVAFVGTGFGPMAVALTTDFVFADDQRLGQSLAAVTAVLTPIGAVSFWFSCRALAAIKPAQG